MSDIVPAPRFTGHSYASRLGMIALFLGFACMARDSAAQRAKESIDGLSQTA